MRNNLIKEWQLLAGFVLLAFAVRLFLLRYEYVLSPDGVYYALLGKNLVSGNFREGLSTYWPPLYPLLVGLSSLLFHDLEFSGRFVSLLTGSLLVIPVYLWSRDSYGKEVAYLSVILTILYPSLTFYSTLVATEPTYTLLLMTGILTGWSAISKGSRGAFFLTGLILGLCYLTRPEAIGYAGLMVVIILSTRLFSNQLRLKKILFNILILLLGFIVLSFPYTLYLHQETGVWTISEKLNAHFSVSEIDSNSRWFGLSDDGQSTLADRLWAGNRIEERSHPVKAAIMSGTGKRDLLNFLFLHLKALKIEYEVMIPQIFPPIFIILSGLGLFGTIWSKERVGREIYLLVFLISTLIGYAIMVPTERYLVPLLPILICWASKGFVEFENWLLKTTGYKNESISGRNLKLLRVLFLSALLLSLLPQITEPIRAEKRNQSFELKEVAEWIKDNTNSLPLVMSTSPLTAFYSGGRHIYLPDEEYPEVLEYARRKKVDYIVINERGVTKLTPPLKFLLDDQSQHPGLDLIYKYDKEPGYKVLVFKLEDNF